jgi:hypothetical protein
MRMDHCHWYSLNRTSQSNPITSAGLRPSVGATSRPATRPSVQICQPLRPDLELRQGDHGPRRRHPAHPPRSPWVKRIRLVGASRYKQQACESPRVRQVRGHALTRGPPAISGSSVYPPGRRQHPALCSERLGHQRPGGIAICKAMSEYADEHMGILTNNEGYAKPCYC